MPESPRMDYLGPATATEEATSRPDESPSQNKFNLSPSPEAYLPPTLETRKKKRRPEMVASSDNDAENGHTATATSSLEANTGSFLKFGSKRKFSLDDDALFDLVSEEDDFQFSRLSRSPQKQKETFQFLAQENSASPSKTPAKKLGSANNSTTKRKVLEPSKHPPFPIADMK